MSRRRKLKVLVATAVVAFAGVTAWLLVCFKEANHQDQLVRDLGARESWYYRWLANKHAKDILNGRPSRVPGNLAKRALQAEMRASMKRTAAKVELIRMRTNAWPVIPALWDALNARDPGMRIGAAEVLAGIDADKHPSWPAFRKRLEKQRKTVEALLYLLQGRNEFGQEHPRACRLFALRGLEAAGPAAQVALPKLTDLCQSKEDYEFRSAAVEAIGSIGGGARHLAPILQKLMADPDEWPQVRSAALQALASVTPDDQQLPGQLRIALEDESAFVRIGAAAALWKLKPQSDETLPVLIKTTTHKLASVRLASLKVLERMGKDARPAKGAVQRLISDENESVRDAAKTVLEKVD